jgi:hypothetical protein
MGVKIQLVEVGAYRSDAIRFLSVGMDEKRSLQRRSKHKRRIGCIMNTAAFIKEERQDDLRRATRAITNRVEKCIEVNGGIFEHLI